MVRVLFVTLAALAALISLAWLLYWWRGFRIRRHWEYRHGCSGKRVLFIYSRSPHWQAYLEGELLPRLEPHVVTLNWSDRKLLERSKPLEWRVFQRYRPARGFNPLAIILPPTGSVETISFWQAFRDYKHGKVITLQKAENHLLTLLAASVSNEHPPHA